MATFVANAVGSSLPTVFGRMLFAFGLLTVMGCALPERTFSRPGSRGFLSERVAKPNACVDLPDDGSVNAPNARSGSEIDRSDTVSSKAGRQLATSGGAGAVSLGQPSQLEPGYSLRNSAVPDSVDRTSISSVPTNDPRLPDKKVAGQAKFAGRTDELRSSGANPQEFTAALNNNTLAAEKSPSPIQLQGLEFDDPPGSSSKSDSPSDAKVRSWSDHIAELARESSKNDAISKSPVEAAKQSVSPVSSAVLPPVKATSPLSPLPWQSDLEQLIARVERDISQSKPDSQPDRQNEFLRKQAQLRLLYLMAQRQEDALTAIPGIDATQQEYWQQMIWALSNSFDTAQFPELAERAAQTVTPLSAALRLTREEAAISIKNMTFCRKISYFGNYERFPRNEFTPGYEVLLYTEIENFVSTPTVDGEYRTSLKSLIEITDSAGKVVWTKGFPPTEDFCRNPRRDYFHNYQFHIPEDLATGTYTLKLTIVDELSHKRASNSLNFVLK